MEETWNHVSQCFGIESVREYQKKAIQWVANGLDVFVSTPTGSGKSLCYQALPSYIEYAKSNVAKPIVLVVTALSSIMREQTVLLNALGFPSVILGKEASKSKLLLGSIRLYSLMLRHVWGRISGVTC